MGISKTPLLSLWNLRAKQVLDEPFVVLSINIKWVRVCLLILLLRITLAPLFQVSCFVGIESPVELLDQGVKA